MTCTAPLSGEEPASAAFGAISRLTPPDPVPPMLARPPFRLCPERAVWVQYHPWRFLGFVATILRAMRSAASGLMWHNAARLNARKAPTAFTVPRMDPIIHPIDSKPSHHQHNLSRRLPDSRPLYPHPRRDLTLHIFSIRAPRTLVQLGGPHCIPRNARDGAYS